MIRSLRFSMAICLLLPAVAWADSSTTLAMQRAYAQVQALQKEGVSPAQGAALQRDLQQMNADQVNPELFAIDQAILQARIEGIRESRGNNPSQHQALEQQLKRLNQRYQSLQQKYGKLRLELAQHTEASARQQRLEEEIQQQKALIQQEEESLGQIPTSPTHSTPPTGSAPLAVPAPAPQPAVPRALQSLAAYGSLRQGKNGTELNLPVTALFTQDHQLSANGQQRLRAIAAALRGQSTEVLVRVASQPGGLNLATQRAEEMLRALRQAGIPQERLALASGAGLSAGTAQILLPSGS